MDINIPEDYKQTEVGVIPKDWDFKRIGEIAVVSSGGTPNRSNLSYWNGNIPWITTSQIDFNTIIYSNEFITKLGLQNSAAKLYAQNTLLMAMYGQGKTRGKIAILGIEATINQACAAITLNKDVSNNYVFFYLAHNYEEIRKLSNTGNQENLNGNIIKSIFVPIPPLPEQKAIAQSLSDVDALITECDRIITKKRDIKQGTMQQLLTGKKRLPSFSGEWEVKKLGDYLIKNPEYGINAPAVPYSDNLPVYIRITDISEDGRFLPEKKVSVNHTQFSNYILETDDLVLARTGASTGKSYLYNPKDGELVFAGFLIRVKVNAQKLDAQYLKGFLKTKPYWNWVNVMSMRSGQPGINGNEYAQLHIPLPPTLKEQKAIAQILSDMDTEIEALEQKRDKYKAIKQGMMQELLTGKTRLKSDAETKIK